MEMALLSVEFFFDGCGSLKEKRTRMGGLRDRFGRLHNVAVTECGYQNDHRRSQWAFVVIGTDRTGVEKVLNQIQGRLEEQVDGRMVQSDVEWL